MSRAIDIAIGAEPAGHCFYEDKGFQTFVANSYKSAICDGGVFEAEIIPPL